MNIKDILESAYPDGRYFTVNQVQVSRDGLRDTLFDNIYLGSKLITEEGMGRRNRNYCPIIYGMKGQIAFK